MAEAGGYHSVNVEERGDNKLTRADDTIHNYKGKYGHLGYWNAGFSMEGGGGDHRNPPEGKCFPPRCSAWVPHREGNGYGNPMVPDLASMDQCPQLLEFLDLQKAYNNIDHGQLLITLSGGNLFMVPKHCQ